MTNDQYERLLARVTKLEQTVSDILVANTQYVTRSQVQQLLVLTQTEQQDLRETVTALDSRVQTLEEEPIN